MAIFFPEVTINTFSDRGPLKLLQYPSQNLKLEIVKLVTPKYLYFLANRYTGFLFCKELFVLSKKSNGILNIQH